MSREWRPGDVAMVTNEYGVDNVAICQVAPGGALWQYGVAYASDRIDLGLPARRLVVIDLEDREQVQRLVGRWEHHQAELEQRSFLGPIVLPVDAMQAALREFANPTPPKPEEPTGLGAVVVDQSNETWVRSRGDQKGLMGVVWENGFSLRHASWSDIAAVKVLSEGVVA